jgi:hypothetical protein
LADPGAAIEVIGAKNDRPEDGRPHRWLIVNYDLLKAHAAGLPKPIDDRPSAFLRYPPRGFAGTA